jgi:hypothetical protein
MNRHAAAMLLTLLCVTPGATQNPFEPDTHVSCIDRLRIPAYSAEARRSRAEGTITASVVLTKDASVDWFKTEFQSKAPKAIGVLMELVEKAIREATFRPLCGGETVSLIFDFKIAGRPADDPQQSASFSYPNRFWIVTEPGKLPGEGAKAK